MIATFVFEGNLLVLLVTCNCESYQGLVLRLPTDMTLKLLFLFQSYKATKNFDISDWCKNFEITFLNEEGMSCVYNHCTFEVAAFIIQQYILTSKVLYCDKHINLN